LAIRPFNRQGDGYNSAGLNGDGNFPAMDEQTDEALMARIAGGDRAAFDLLAQRHAGSVVRLAAHILRNRADAEDVAQDAMLRVWTNAPRWKPVAKFRTWLTRIVVNLCLDRKRRATSPIRNRMQLRKSKLTKANGSLRLRLPICRRASARPSRSLTARDWAMRKPQRFSTAVFRRLRHCWFVPRQACGACSMMSDSLPFVPAQAGMKG
jgi:RNA polymerase sigma factor (sigma-70 family)